MRQLVAHALNTESSELYLKWNEDVLPQSLVADLDGIVDRRRNGEPFQYITGSCAFWKHTFRVGPGVLIPRPETEELLEGILGENLPVHARIAELGAGSGNLGISAVLEKPSWVWHAFEMNAESLPYLYENRKVLAPGINYVIHELDFFNYSHELSFWDAIVANPPYVATCALPLLQPEVRQEPRIAFDGGQGGLAIIRRFIDESHAWLVPGGLLAFEIGSDQKRATERLLQARGYGDISIRNDFAGLARMAFARKPC
jgi:release factor glutamine methyltransferase